MSLLAYMGVIGGICSLAGYVPYARSIMRGESEPQRASWLVWTLSSLLIVISYWHLGARSTIWVPISYVAGSALITALAYTHGKSGWDSLEKLALVVAIISSVRWVYFDQPVVALVLNGTIGLIGYVPRIVNLIRYREKKDTLEIEGWTLFFLGSILNLVAVNDWRPTIAALPIAIFALNGVMLALTLRNSLIQEKADHEDHSHIS